MPRHATTNYVSSRAHLHVCPRTAASGAEKKSLRIQKAQAKTPIPHKCSSTCKPRGVGLWPQRHLNFVWGRAVPCGGLPDRLFTPEERRCEPRAGHGPAPLEETIVKCTEI